MKAGLGLKRRHVLGVLAALAAARAVRAEEAPPPEQGPATPALLLNRELLRLMKIGHTRSFADRMALLRPAVEQAFNLPLILQNSIGVRYTSIPAAAQAELLEVFTQFTVASYVANFDSFDGERFELLPGLRHVGADDVVQTRIVPPSGDPTRLDYVVRSADGAWRIIDVLLNGSISRVAVQRSDFRSLIGSGDPTPLINNLRSKVAALAAGA
jgi:phospholipid transport system substrate-binding protein